MTQLLSPSSFAYTSMSLAGIAVTSAIVLAACGPERGEPVANQAVQTAPAPRVVAVAPPPVVIPSSHRGAISNIETLTERPQGSGVGAVAGGVLGGVVGHQVGNGDGQRVATAAGAIGGALLGNKIERDRAVKVIGYRVDVRLDNGEMRSFQETQLNGLQVGDRVKVEAGQLRRA